MLYEYDVQYVLQIAMKSKIITVSAISAALIAACLTVGAYFEVADIFTVIMASAFIILPIYRKSYLGCILAALVGGVLAFIFSSFNILTIVFPSYFTFFAFYPIVRCFFQDKKFNKYVGYIIGLVWCVAVFYGIYFYYVFVMQMPFNDLPTIIADYIYVFIGLFGIVFFAVYERFIVILRRVIERYLSRIIK